MNIQSLIYIGLTSSLSILIGYMFRDVPKNIFNYIKSKVLKSLEVGCYLEIYYDILNYIEEKYKNKNFKTYRINDGLFDYRKTNLNLGNGNHIIKFKNKRFFINISREKDNNSSRPKDTLKIYCLTRNKYIFEEFLKNVKIFKKQNENKDNIQVSELNEGIHFYINKRSFKNIYIEQNKIDLIKNTISNFLNRKEWYSNNGIPYHLGILLYGNPRHW